MIDNAGLDDRLDEDPQSIEGLMASIREYGQQVPVLLRQSSRSEGRYDVVFGRRRVAAMRRLGMPVKAMVRSLNDRKLVVAQGQENSARKNLSFIEKANFAGQMVAAGYDRKLVCDGCAVDRQDGDLAHVVGDRGPARGADPGHRRRAIGGPGPLAGAGAESRRAGGRRPVAAGARRRSGCALRSRPGCDQRPPCPPAIADLAGRRRADTGAICHVRVVNLLILSQKHLCHSFVTLRNVTSVCHLRLRPNVTRFA